MPRWHVVTHGFCHDFGDSVCEKCALKMFLLRVLQIWFAVGEGDDGCDDDGGGSVGGGGDGDDVSGHGSDDGNGDGGDGHDDDSSDGDMVWG